jgi:predicted DNA-binding protein (MmcQ/YjbR family)
VTPAELEAFCLSFPGVESGPRAEGERALTVHGEPFAVLGPGERVSFACSAAGFGLLIRRPGIVPAAFPARLDWVTLERADLMPADDLLDQLRLAYGLVLQTLPEAVRRRLIGELQGRTGRTH